MMSRVPLMKESRRCSSRYCSADTSLRLQYLLSLLRVFKELIQGFTRLLPVRGQEDGGQIFILRLNV